MKLWIQCFAYLLFALSAGTTLGDEVLKIGSWNIEHYGKNKKGGQNPGDVADYIALAGVDVLALQELYDTDHMKGTRRNAALDATISALNKNKGHDWEYLMFPNRQQNDSSQLCGIAWNKARVTRDGDPFKIPMIAKSTFNLWDRHPHALKFSAGTGKTDFVVIPLHMKATKFPPTPQDLLNAQQQRHEEALALVGALAEVKKHFNDEDIVILGDTNCRGAEEEAVKAFVSGGFRDLNAKDLSTYVSEIRTPFDRIFVPKGRPAFASSRQYGLIAADQRDHDRRLSDHFLVVAAIAIVDDDD